MRLLLLPAVAAMLAPFAASLAAHAGDLRIAPVEVDDRKAVLATVEPVRQLAARTRIGGTIATLKVREGDLVKAGDAIANVTDQKLALQMQALDQRIRSQAAQRDQARTDFERVQELQRRGVSSQTQLDQARTGLDVAERNLAAMQADRSVLEQQVTEGAVLAPGAGRVLNAPVSEGRVVMPGEVVATLAEDNYVLRLSLPERHAQTMKAGDTVLIGERGADNPGVDVRRKGRVRLVYPEIQGGRVIADVDVQNLGDYFVGERTRVYVATGKRTAIVVPARAVYRRAGANFVHLADGSEIVVQPGETDTNGTEILSGLAAGDVVSVP